MSKSILITGGAGFIGSHVVKLFVANYPLYRIVNLDALTYAGNLENLVEVEGAPNYFFEKADIQEEQVLEAVFAKHGITDVIHLAAESHVDRSISDPLAFVRTNVFGTVNLLNVAKKLGQEPWINTCSIMFQRMKCMVLCMMEDFSWRLQHTILNHPILHRKQLPTIL